MRRLILLLTTALLGACAAPIGVATSTPIGSTPTSDPMIKQNDPTATAVPPITSTTSPGFQADLPDLGVASELQNTVWLNTDRPLRLTDLRGKVVLLDMWTFDCINCQHVIPALRTWYDKYSPQGFVVIGNHFPEFGFERDLNNLKEAIQRLNVRYPVAQDNDGVTWQAYGTRYWPTLFLIDKRGHVRYTHIGEGAYGETEQAIQALLKEG